MIFYKKHSLVAAASAAFFAIMFAQSVRAAEPLIMYNVDVDGDRVAFSRVAGNEVVAYDVVAAYNNDRVIVADCARYFATFSGVKWCFMSNENRDVFVAAIDGGGKNRYLPAFGGRCALGVSGGSFTARGDPRTAVRIGSELVLNGTFEVRARFLVDTRQNMRNAAEHFARGMQSGELVPNEELTN